MVKIYSKDIDGKSYNNIEDKLLPYAGKKVKIGLSEEIKDTLLSIAKQHISNIAQKNNIDIIDIVRF